VSAPSPFVSPDGAPLRHCHSPPFFFLHLPFFNNAYRVCNDKATLASFLNGTGMAMDGKIGLFNALSKRMDWLTQRETVLAENIANADTPGYVAKDLDESSFAKALGNSSQFHMVTARTEPGHMRGTLDGTTAHTAYKERKPYETKPSGNSVVIEEQMVKVAKTESQHTTMTNLYSKYMKMFGMALGSSGG
jgi:flagellar basal-body rod protein FlgB